MPPLSTYMPLRRSSILALSAVACALAAALLAAPAHAGTHLWATVNLCDTPSYPNRIGIWGRMPGTDQRGKSWMRFITQYETKDGWRQVSGSDSGWQLAGSSKKTFQAMGWRFQIKPPAGHGHLLLRGLVRFEWRRDGRAIDWDRQYTESGHPTGFGDPKWHSAATCSLAY